MVAVLRGRRRRGIVGARTRVTSRVCSNCAVRDRSRVGAVQPSDQMRPSSHDPSVIIGSMVNVMPGDERRVGVRVVVVRDRRRGVELLADAVTDESTHDTEARALRRASWIARPMSLHAAAGLNRVDALPHRFLGDLHELAAGVVDVADEERRVAVAVHAVEEDRDVAVDDVAVEEHAVVGDAVADDLVHRRAQRLREALVVQRARVAAACDARFVADAVELVGGDARPHRRADLERAPRVRRVPPARMRSANSSGGTAGMQGRRIGRVRRTRDLGRHRASRREPARRGLGAAGRGRARESPTPAGAGRASPSAAACSRRHCRAWPAPVTTAC